MFLSSRIRMLTKANQAFSSRVYTAVNLRLIRSGSNLSNIHETMENIQLIFLTGIVQYPFLKPVWKVLIQLQIIIIILYRSNITGINFKASS